jgi:hypothetical protein
VAPQDPQPSLGSPLHSLEKLGFELNWTLVAVGWYGPGKLDRQLNVRSVVEFAITRLASLPSDPFASELMILSDCEREKADEILRAAAESENLSQSTELRKWIVYLLERRLSDLPQDPLYGLIALTEFWESFDYPEYSPHNIRGDCEEPSEYYSQGNFRREVEKHVRWIQEQLVILRASN